MGEALSEQKPKEAMKQFFRELFDYSHHYNQRLADIFLDNSGQVSEKSVKLFNHILNAHQIWNNRIDPIASTCQVWALHPLEELKGMDQHNYEHTVQLLVDENLDRILNYSTSGGLKFSNSVRDILFHVINHSTYHRGQIAAEFRANGIEPLATDFIFFKR
jgi:uncharacterized damage-inducible protein DinB